MASKALNCFFSICRSNVLDWATQALILSQKMKGKRLFCFLQPNYYFFSSFLAWSKLVIKKSPHAKGLGCACAHPLTTADTYKSILILAYHFRTPDAANDFSLASLKSCLGFTASIFGGIPGLFMGYYTLWVMTYWEGWFLKCTCSLSFRFEIFYIHNYKQL